MQVREFQDGGFVAQALLVRAADARRRPDGTELLRVSLGDRTGMVTAVITGELERARDTCRPGSIVWVAGPFGVHQRYGPQLTVELIRVADPGEYDLTELLDGPMRSPEQMEADLRQLVATIHNASLRRLLNHLLGESAPTWALFREWPAAKHYHQAYRHGLLEHSLSVAQAVSAASATFPGVDRDVAVTGGLLHDIGKIDAYTMHGEAIAMSDHGRLFGEIALGYYRVRRAIEEIDGFPSAPAEALVHIILSHHGSLEHGSPVVPCTREATLVHMIDNLGGRLGSFDRVEKTLPLGAQWSSFDKGIGGGAYFGERADPQRQAA